MKDQRNTGYLRADVTKAGDECLTPRYAVLPIIKYLKQREYKTIWCPFDKEHSFFVRVLREHGFDVIYSHIDDGLDFFEYYAHDADCIVSNPPFSIKDQILERLYFLGKPFAVLLPQNALQSERRTGLFMVYGMEYLGFCERIGYYTRGEFDAWKNGNHFASAYFCKDVLPEKMIFESLDKVQEPYFSIEEMLDIPIDINSMIR